MPHKREEPVRTRVSRGNSDKRRKTEQREKLLDRVKQKAVAGDLEPQRSEVGGLLREGGGIEQIERRNEQEGDFDPTFERRTQGSTRE